MDDNELRRMLRDMHRRTGAAIIAASAVYVRDVAAVFAAGSAEHALASIAASLMLLGSAVLLWATEPKS